MIVLNNNSSNTVTLTLNEKKTLDTPYYFFKLINDQDLSEKIFYAANNSINKDRYDQFTWILTGTTSEVVANGWINVNEGFYKYEAYESLINSLVPSDWTGLVERGKVYVSGTTQTILSYSGNNITSTVVYRT